jgi:hypothetical protein
MAHKSIHARTMTMPLSLLLLSAALILGGCASSTQLITNEKASETVKAKSFKNYKEVLLIPPKEDPRKLVPRVVSGIEGMTPPSRSTAARERPSSSAPMAGC